MVQIKKERDTMPRQKHKICMVTLPLTHISCKSRKKYIPMTTKLNNSHNTKGYDCRGRTHIHTAKPELTREWDQAPKS